MQFLFMGVDRVFRDSFESLLLVRIVACELCEVSAEVVFSYLMVL